MYTKYDIQGVLDMIDPPNPIRELMKILSMIFFIFIAAYFLLTHGYKAVRKGHENGWLYPFLGALIGFFWIVFISSFTGGLLAFLIILTIPIFLGLGFASHRLYKWRKGELFISKMREKGYTLTDLARLFAGDEEGDGEGYYYDDRVS